MDGWMDGSLRVLLSLSLSEFIYFSIVVAVVLPVVVRFLPGICARVHPSQKAYSVQQHI